MEFNNTQAIYLQIADYVCHKIQQQEWREDEKIASVREMAVALEVNPHTVMRAFDHLQQQDIIYIKRGMGYYVSKNAPQKILQAMKQQFMEEELPTLFRKLILMDTDIKDIVSRFDDFKKTISTTR